MANYVSVFKANSFINFQEYLPVWFKQLKYYAYSIDQALGGKGVEATKGGNHNGFILELTDKTKADAYFTTKDFPLVQNAIGIVAGSETRIAATLVPGSVSIVLTNGVFLVDDGEGQICRVDGNNTKVGTINYTTGNYILDDTIITTDAKAYVSYAVVGTNVSYAKIGGVGTTIKGFDTAFIPNGQCFFTLQVIVSTNSKKMFVGFSSNDAGKQEIALLLGDTIPAIVIDLADLQDAIAAALVLIGATDTGVEVGDVSAGNKTTYQNAIDAAELVEADPDSDSQAIANAVGILAVATAAFEDAIIVEVVKTTLQGDIADALVLIGLTVTGTEIGQVAGAAKTTYQNAIDAAEVVEANVSATTAQVSSAVSTLGLATTAFTNAIIDEVSKTAIHDAIAAALVLIGATVTGTDPGEVAAEDKVTYQNAIDAAEVVEADRDATTGEVSGAIVTLGLATTAFEGAIIGA